ncbi:type I-F CRISPR-associated protein Csy1 [Moraxella nasovis]|uniref:type I-F CRISPR-associated protein Csy1 n=1 Tax=Moraxella nasovis TaxID=2904121 RepID=UPI001F6251DE|nr:type I-F CRISPR-associated protein Csy1 [Moraxella nasovis]UNU73184.1 type I-F CRISPR-associated protein Csy1 [Moraxella nasovis]
MITSITERQIKDAVQAFLTAQYDKKTEKEQKQLAKAIEENDVAKIAEINAILQPFKDKYQKSAWLIEAKKMAEHVQVGTHVSKGVHSSSRGDNVNFNQAVGHDFVNTKTIESRFLDANSPRGAIDLPLVSFFEWEIADTGVKMREAILQNSSAVQACFADDLDLSKQFQQTFLDCLNNQIKQPKTHESNKQILWALTQDTDSADDGNGYVTLVPLYPAVLAHEFFQMVNQKRYSDENKLARDNRTKKTAKQQPYLTMKDMATVQLGGTKPQNVSQLMSKQGGRNYLLPSMPPIFRQSQGIRLSPNEASIFATKALEYKAKDALQSLFNLIKTNYNNVNIRDARKAILSDIAYQVISMGETLQTVRSAGWSKDYHNLSMNQKYWLDPKRAELDGEEEFKLARETKDWRAAIEVDFANWLQAIFRREFKAIAHDFADPEHLEWRREMEDEIKKALRLGKGGLA